MGEAWRSVLFCDEDQERKKARDPVAPAKRSKAALEKVNSKVLADGSAVHSFHTLLKLLSTVARNRCRVPAAGRTRRPSMWSPRRQPNNSGHSIYWRQSRCSQNGEHDFCELRRTFHQMSFKPAGNFSLGVGVETKALSVDYAFRPLRRLGNHQ